MTKRTITRVAAVVAAALVLLGVTTGPAMADVIGTGGTATTSVRTGSTQYQFTANNNRDFGWDATEVDPIRMRWTNCAETVHGAWVNISATAGRQTIGTNFLNGSCIKFQWQLRPGYTTPRAFRGWAHWNYNWA